MTRFFLGSSLLCCFSLLASSSVRSEDKFKTYEEAYSTGAKAVNGGNLAAAREPLETALKLAKTDKQKIEAQRALLIPYRELPQIEPMQSAAEFIIAKSDQSAERSLSRGSLLGFIQKRGKMEDAVKGYEERLKQTPEDRTLLYILAEAQRTYQKNPARSIELGEKLASVEKKLGNKVDVYEQSQLAGQYVKASKFKDGAELFESIAPLDAKMEAWHFKEAAAAWMKGKDSEKALAAARKSEKAATPEKRTELLTHFWHRGLGDVFLDAGAPKDAIPHYQQAIASTKIAGYVKDCQAKLAKAEAEAKR
jgi:hypothetical protein